MASLPPSPYTRLQLKAQKVLRAAARVLPAQVMSSPPTIVNGCTGLATIAVNAGGSGYAVGDTGTVNGGTLQSGGAAAQYRVTAIGGGAVTGVALVPGRCGEYTFGNGPASGAATTPTSGGGSGLTLNTSQFGSPVNPGKQSTYGGQTVLADDARITKLGGLLAFDAANNNWRAAYISRTAGSASFTGAQGGSTYGWGIGFATDSQYIDVNLFIGSGAMIGYTTDLATGIRQRWQANDIANHAFVKVDFGSSRPRYVELYFSPGALRGIDIMPTASLWKHQPADAVTALALHDSYGEAQGATNRVRGSHVYLTGELLGAANILNNAVAGSGAMATSSGAVNTFGQRTGFGNIDTGLVGAVDLVLLFASVNDRPANGFTAGQITAAWTALAADVLARQPGAIVVVFGPPNPSNYVTQAIYDAVRTGVQAAGGGARLLYVDTSPSAEPVLTGSGNVSAPSGNGNGDLYVTADTVHCNDAGHAFIAQREAQLALRALRGISGL